MIDLFYRFDHWCIAIIVIITDLRWRTHLHWSLEIIKLSSGPTFDNSVHCQIPHHSDSNSDLVICNEVFAIGPEETEQSGCTRVINSQNVAVQQLKVKTRVIFKMKMHKMIL